MRSKRRAPMPPPLPPKGEGLRAVGAANQVARQSSATAPGPIISTGASQDQQDILTKDPNAMGVGTDAERLPGVGAGEYRGKGSGVPPPRPPPPKFETTCGPLIDYEKSYAERQYQMEHGIGLPPTPKVLVSSLADGAS